MSTADVLETPKELGSIGITSSATTFLPLKTKIVTDDSVVEIEGSLITPSVLRRLRRMEDGSYKLPDEWNVRAAQLSALFDLIHSSK